MAFAFKDQARLFLVQTCSQRKKSWCKWATPSHHIFFATGQPQAGEWFPYYRDRRGSQDILSQHHSSGLRGDLLSPSTPALQFLSLENSRLSRLKKKHPKRDHSIAGHSLEGDFQSFLQEQVMPLTGNSHWIKYDLGAWKTLKFSGKAYSEDRLL